MPVVTVPSQSLLKQGKYSAEKGDYIAVPMESQSLLKQGKYSAFLGPSAHAAERLNPF